MQENKLTYIEVETTEHTAWIYFNRPKASNAFTVEMIEEFIWTLKKYDKDSNTRCIVISGRGKHFSAGGDIKNMLSKKEMFAGEANELRERYIHGIQEIPKTFIQLSTPTIGMVNGAAIGAGLDISCMCDIRLASDQAKFGETFTKLGLIPGDAGTYFLQRIVGFAKAMEMTLTAQVYCANQAKQMGLISEYYSLEELKENVNNFVKLIINNAPIATKMAKRAIEHGYRSDLNSHLDLLAAYQGITQRTSDHFDALNAMMNKSQVNFKHQ